MEKVNNHLVIMAGGVGSRFWPMSTTERPKQFWISYMSNCRTCLFPIFSVNHAEGTRLLV